MRVMRGGGQGSVWCVACDGWDCVIARALERVEELLPNMAIDAPIGSVVVEMRRFVRLEGEEVASASPRVGLWTRKNWYPGW